MASDHTIQHALDEEVPVIDLVHGFPSTPDAVSAEQALKIVARINTMVDVR